MRLIGFLPIKKCMFNFNHVFDGSMRRAWILALGMLLFFWIISLASFSVEDPPSILVSVTNNPTDNLCGHVGAWVAWWTYRLMGFGSWVLPITFIYWLYKISLGNTIEHPRLRLVGLFFLTASLSGFHALCFPSVGAFGVANAGLFATWSVQELLVRFDFFGTFIILFGALGVGLLVSVEDLTQLVIKNFCSYINKCSKSLNFSAVVERFYKTINYVLKFRPRPQFAGSLSEEITHVQSNNEAMPIEDDPWDEEEVLETKIKRLSSEELKKKIAQLPVRQGQSTKVAREEDLPRDISYEGYQFPSLNLLDDPEAGYSKKIEALIRRQAEKLEEGLHTFGIDGEVVGIESGPTVTLYSIQLAPGTKVAKLSSVSSDLARTLGTQNIRIVANMAGRTTVGIEVPNPKREQVRLKELMAGDEAKNMLLPMFLGKDSAGDPLIGDLATMPHMLIAGTTGSGKSVCINTIILSWLFTRRPDELKLILVDPKVVELSQFADIPHLACPVVTEMPRAAAILEWAVNKMEERYELMKQAGVRDLSTYNNLDELTRYKRFGAETDAERARIPKKLPSIVFVVDELADLIMTHREVEHSIVRIAQKARAVGIHLILATQRPQANVVTGLIKSNMPCRVSFKVASGMDSRIVLDQKGAELMLGKGDMMMVTPDHPDARRSQGTFITDDEIRDTVSFLRDVAAPNYERSLIRIRPDGELATESNKNSQSLQERDSLFEKAVTIILETGRGSVSLLQRRLAIGYGRASRLIDQMAMAGIIGEHKGSVAREVLIGEDDWKRMQILENKGDIEDEYDIEEYEYVEVDEEENPSEYLEEWEEVDEWEQDELEQEEAEV